LPLLRELVFWGKALIEGDEADVRARLAAADSLFKFCSPEALVLNR
jgi:hypothetical protein